jgi:hypothetical protein
VPPKLDRHLVPVRNRLRDVESSAVASAPAIAYGFFRRGKWGGIARERGGQYSSCVFESRLTAHRKAPRASSKAGRFAFGRVGAEHEGSGWSRRTP